MPTFASLLAHPKPLIGVLHLPPLPGAPRSGPGLRAILEGAVRDARILARGGAQAVIVENLGDAPFAELVEPHVTAMLAVVAQHVVAAVGTELLVGVNALRNDGLSALGAAAASEAGFVRINVLSGAMVTDQGVIQGRARETLLYRNRVAPQMGIVADVMVKHASPLGMGMNLAQAAKDCFGRGGADVLVVSGSGTGAATSPADLEAVRLAVPAAPLWIGSGFSLATAEILSPLCTGAIVGTALHQGGELDAPLDLERVRAIRAALG
jgi:membrane complex biogenesis BtpA family protein